MAGVSETELCVYLPSFSADTSSIFSHSTPSTYCSISKHTHAHTFHSQLWMPWTYQYECDPSLSVSSLYVSDEAGPQNHRRVLLLYFERQAGYQNIQKHNWLNQVMTRKPGKIHYQILTKVLPQRPPQGRQEGKGQSAWWWGEIENEITLEMYLMELCWMLDSVGHSDRHSVVCYFLAQTDNRQLLWKLFATQELNRQFHNIVTSLQQILCSKVLNSNYWKMT